MFSVSMSDTLSALKKGKLITTLGRLIGAKTGRHKVVTLRGKDKKNYNSIPADERLTKEDIEQGTITITSTGSVYRGSHNTMSVIEVIPPQISAIGIGSISEKPGIYTDRNGEKQIGIRMFLPVLLVFDHRALDFGDLTPFFKKIDDIFATPEQILKW